MKSRHCSLLLFVLSLMVMQRCAWSKGGVDGDILSAAKSIEDWIISIRRQLHQIPELNYDLPKTSAFVRKVLDDLGVTYRCFEAVDRLE